MEPIPFSRLLLGYGLMFGLPLAVLWFPRSRWARYLTSNVGPELDVRRQTRGDCLRNAGTFFLFGVVALAAGIGTGIFAAKWFGAVDRVLPAAVLAFTYMLLGFVGLGGCVYLLIRAPFRPRVLAVPPADIRVRVLKPYESRDRTYIVLLCVDPEDRYVVLVPAHVGIDGPAPARAIGPFATLEEAERVALGASGHGPSAGV